MDGLDLNLVVLAAAALLLAGLVAIKASVRLGAPVLLLFVALGMLLGESGLGLRFDDADLTVQAGTLLLAVILWEGGYTTSTSAIRPVVARSLVLATAGVLISVAVASTLVYLILDVDGRTALILGSVASSTDAAATFAVLRTVPVLRRVRTTLEAESGMNDPPVIVLVAVVVSDAWEELSPWAMAGTAIYQLIVGAAVGIGVAWVGVRLLRISALPASGLYPIATVGIGMVAFAGAGKLAASGILACYVAALIVGNSEQPHKRTTTGFVEALAWVAQMGLFMMLGLLASPGQLPGAFWTAMIVGGVLTFVARPISVVLCLLPFRVPWREQVFISWGGLRGAVPIVLAAMALAAQVPQATRIFDVTFLLVIVFALIQGPTLPRVARMTGMATTDELNELVFESAPLEEVDLVALHVSIPNGSRLHGVRTSELRLPPQVTIPMLIRGDQVIVPRSYTYLRRGDDLVFTAPRHEIEPLQRRLRALGEIGRLAGWHASAPEVRQDHPRGAWSPESRPPSPRLPGPEARRARSQLDASG